MLPFSSESLLALFAHYNRTVWPAQPLAYLLGIAILWLCLRPRPGSDRAIAALLALSWGWIGIAYHMMHFASINFAAPAFVAIFMVQALLFAWRGTVRGKLAFRFRAGLAGWTGLGLAGFAMLGYPLLGWLAGHVWPRAPVFGVAPGPTVIFTMGLLLLMAGRTPLHLTVLPVLWSLIGGAAAWLLHMPENLSLPLAGLGGLLVILWKNRHFPAG